MHPDLVRFTGVRYAVPKCTHVLLQIMEETTFVTLLPGLYHGNVSRDRAGADVLRGAAGTGRRQGRHVDELRVLHSWFIR